MKQKELQLLHRGDAGRLMPCQWYAGSTTVSTHGFGSRGVQWYALAHSHGFSFGLRNMQTYTNPGAEWLERIVKVCWLGCLYQPVAPPQDAHRKLADLDVMDPEWDLLVKIQATLRELPRVHLKYVKWHQEDKVPYNHLPLFAQLNVDADKERVNTSAFTERRDHSH
jgi:hypothetical protein